MFRNKLFSITVVILAIGLIIFGIIHGDVAAVWNKARLICLECIGVG